MDTQARVCTDTRKLKKKKKVLTFVMNTDYAFCN